MVFFFGLKAFVISDYEYGQSKVPVLLKMTSAEAE